MRVGVIIVYAISFLACMIYVVYCGLHKLPRYLLQLEEVLSPDSLWGLLFLDHIIDLYIPYPGFDKHLFPLALWMFSNTLVVSF